MRAILKRYLTLAASASATHALLAALLTVFVASSCGKSEDSDPALDALQKEVEALFPVRLDPEIDKPERRRVLETFKAVPDFQIRARRGSDFEDAFGGLNSEAVRKYLSDRIHYVVPSNYGESNRLGSTSSAEISRFSEAIDSEDNERGYEMAENLSVRLWSLRELLRPKNLKFRVGEDWLPIESSRIGVIAVKSGFLLGIPAIQDRAVIRVATLVHEARHSDCTGGLKKSDLQRARNSDSHGVIPISNECGHLHVLCPMGHPLADEYACDNHAWGAYALGKLYSDAIDTACVNCSEAERADAAAYSIDSRSRILVLDAMDSGALGRPDMRNQGVVDE